MNTTLWAYQARRVLPLRDRDYYYFLLYHVRQATHRIWASVFIVNVKRADDPRSDVRRLLAELSAAARRGVDVRVTTGYARDNLALYETNAITRTFLHGRRVNVRRYPGGRREQTHNKLVLFDTELAVLGSHNWSHNAFSVSAEDSVALWSRDAVEHLERDYLETWNLRSKQEAPDES